MGGRLNVDFKNRLKLDLFLKSYIYSERGDFAASFYNKNSFLMFFSKWSIFRGGGALTYHSLVLFLKNIKNSENQLYSNEQQQIIRPMQKEIENQKKIEPFQRLLEIFCFVLKETDDFYESHKDSNGNSIAFEERGEKEIGLVE